MCVWGSVLVCGVHVNGVVYGDCIRDNTVARWMMTTETSDGLAAVVECQETRGCEWVAVGGEGEVGGRRGEELSAGNQTPAQVVDVKGRSLMGVRGGEPRCQLAGTTEGRGRGERGRGQVGV